MTDPAPTDPHPLDVLSNAFPEASFGPASLMVVRAPGRVNLIGEHTDYNDGLVLPAAISLAIEIAFVPTGDEQVTLALAATGEVGRLDLRHLDQQSGTWIDYVAGMAWSMKEAGLPPKGFTGILRSTIPAGAGLSSSAAIELASAWALSGESGPALDPMALALAAQRAENEYVGVQCGLMDQFAVAFGRPDAALLLDCRSLEWHPVAIPSSLELVVCHSGSPRRLESSAYNARRAECARAVAAIAPWEPHVRALRDVDVAMLERYRDRIDDVAFARALHVVTENRRVLEAEAALQSGDRDALGRIFAASHASLRDRFDVSSGPLDALVEIAVATPGVVGARLTGAGFGGCTVNLVERGRSDELRAAIGASYEAMTGLVASVFAVDAVGGAGLVPSGSGD